jgi:hypothetical protein
MGSANMVQSIGHAAHSSNGQLASAAIARVDVDVGVLVRWLPQDDARVCVEFWKDLPSATGTKRRALA